MTRLIYLCFAIGVGLWQFPLVYYVFNSVKSRFILRQNLKRAAAGGDEPIYRGIYLKLNKLIIATSMSRHLKKPEDVIYISLILGVGVGISTYFIGGMSMSLICGILALSLPTVLLLMRLNGKRIGSSREGDLMIQELLANYKVYDFNMKEAIEVTSRNLEGAPYCKSLLVDLINRLNKVFTKEEVEKVLDDFKYSLGTAWGNALASDIYFAQVHGIKVTESLEDLAQSITKSRQVVEHSRREHNEAHLMLKYLAPISYVLSVICACRFFGFTLSKFIIYQFTTGLGLQWFVITMVLYIVGLVMNSWLSNEKMDI